MYTVTPEGQLGQPTVPQDIPQCLPANVPAQVGLHYPTITKKSRYITYFANAKLDDYLHITILDCGYIILHVVFFILLYKTIILKINEKKIILFIDVYSVFFIKNFIKLYW